MSVDAEEFVRVFQGKLDGFPATQVETVFKQISDDKNQVSFQSVLSNLNTQKYPEVVEGFSEFMGAYCSAAREESNNGTTLTQEEFVSLHRDLYTSLPSKFNEVLKAIWTPAH